MSTLYSIGQMNQLGDALEGEGFTPDEVTKLRTSGVLGNLKNVLNGVAIIKMLERVFPTWRTIKLGTHKNVKALKKAITDASQQISDWSNDIMGKPAFTLASEEISIDLVTATVAELGFTGNTRYDAICARIRELDYELCPAEVGPQLRRQYTDQPPHEVLVVAMEAISGSDGDLFVFRVRHSRGGRWLSTYFGRPDYLFGPGNRFVFRRK